MIDFLSRMFDYFTSSTISIVFFLFLCVAHILNVIRDHLVSSEKKTGYPDRACIRLAKGRKGQVCTSSRYKTDFKKRNNSCEGCKGKNVSITNDEVLEQITASATWKRIIVYLSNWCKSILPYMAFLYTLLIAIFETSN